MSEELVLSNLLNNEKYARKVLPYLHIKLFQEKEEKAIFKAIVNHFDNYNILPSKTEVKHYINEDSSLTDDQYNNTIEYISTLSNDDVDYNWLLDTTEKWVQNRSLYNAIRDSISIIDGTDTKHNKHAIQDMLKDALAVSFDTHIGHDYFDEAEQRFDFYSLEKARIPFHLDFFNKITNGGIPRKTLNVIMGTTNAGKSLMLADFAANYLLNGLNVLYVTLEMAEEAIANRIDANLMNVPLNAVEKMDKDVFIGKVGKIKNKTNGKLIIKEYPTTSAHAGHIKNLLQELKLKKNFIPDIIMVDYINIMASSRVKLANTNSYFYIKSIAEELRALAVEYDVPVWSATQSNRSGHSDTDIDLTNTSESFGLPATVDFMVALIRTDELDQLNQIMIKQLKSRYGNKSYYEKFIIGVDIDKMKFFDAELSAQNISQSTQAPPPVNNDKPKRSLKI